MKKPPRTLVGLATVLLSFASGAAGHADELSTNFRDGHVGDCTSCHRPTTNDWYEFDRSESRIHFAVENYGFAFTLGAFTIIEGGFVFDPDKWEEGSVVVTVRTASLDTSSEFLNTLLRGERFLDTDNYPILAFRSTRITQTGPRTAMIEGFLTMHGVTNKFSLKATFDRTGVHPVTNRYIAGFTAFGSLNRSDYEREQVPGFSDRVNISIQALGTRLN